MDMNRKTFFKLSGGSAAASLIAAATGAPMDAAGGPPDMKPKKLEGAAIKGATEAVREFFLKNMSTRAAKMLVDDMQAMGPVRLRDVDEAQSLLVNLAKDLAAKGEIILSKSRDEELIY
jgi:hypothetical protein